MLHVLMQHSYRACSVALNLSKVLTHGLQEPTQRSFHELLQQLKKNDKRELTVLLLGREHLFCFCFMLRSVHSTDRCHEILCTVSPMIALLLKHRQSTDRQL